jgi:hypothetical protein
VDAAAGRRGGAAQDQAGDRRGVGAQGRPQDEAHEVVGPAADVAADEVPVVSLEIARVVHGAGQDQPAEAGCVPLDLLLVAIGHGVALARPADAVRDQAVGPQGVVAGRRPRRIRQRLLAHEHERVLRETTGAPLGRLAREVGQVAPDVHRPGPAGRG